MARQNLGILDIEKKKKKDLDAIKPNVGVNQGKLFGVDGVKPLTPTLAPTVAPKDITTPTVPTLAPVVQGMTDAQKKAEAELRQVTPAGLVGEGVDTPVVDAVEDAVDTPTSEDLNAQLNAVRRQNAINALKSAFQKNVGALQQEEAQIDPLFREKQGQVRTQDTMARAGAEKILATQGLAGSGARTQSDIAQNVLTQGAVGALNQQELQAKADIKRRMTELEQDFNAGVATIESEAEMAELQSQLDATVAKETAALKAIELQDERDYDLYIRELDKLDDREKAIFEADLEREQTLLDAEIAAAVADKKFAEARALEAQKAANSVKLEGIKQSNRLELKAEDDATIESGMSVSSIGTSINNFIKRKESDNVTDVNAQIEEINKQIAALPLEDFQTRQALEAQSTALKNQSGRLSGDQQKQAAMLFIIENPAAFKNANDLREVLTRYGITEEEIVEREAQIKTAPASQGF